MRRYVYPPATPPALPHGNARGGVLEAAWVPMTYIDERRITVPTDSPQTYQVTQDVFLSPVSFTDSQTIRQISPAPAPVAGYGDYLQPAYGRMPDWRQRADPRAIPIASHGLVRTPHGDTEGGIFGSQAVVGGIATGGRVPMVATRRIIQERGVSGFGHDEQGRDTGAIHPKFRVIGGGMPGGPITGVPLQPGHASHARRMRRFGPPARSMRRSPWGGGMSGGPDGIGGFGFGH